MLLKNLKRFQENIGDMVFESRKIQNAENTQFYISFNKKIMKIGLLTIWREKNFGAEMQAYATIKALQNLGHDVEMIDFRLSDIAHPTIKQRIIKILTYITKEDFKFRKFWKITFRKDTIIKNRRN